MSAPLERGWGAMSKLCWLWCTDLPLQRDRGSTNTQTKENHTSWRLVLWSNCRIYFPVSYDLYTFNSITAEEISRIYCIIQRLERNEWQGTWRTSMMELDTVNVRCLLLNTFHSVWILMVFLHFLPTHHQFGQCTCQLTSFHQRPGDVPLFALHDTFSRTNKCYMLLAAVWLDKKKPSMANIMGNYGSKNFKEYLALVLLFLQFCNKIFSGISIVPFGTRSSTIHLQSQIVVHLLRFCCKSTCNAIQRLQCHISWRWGLSSLLPSWRESKALFCFLTLLFRLESYTLLLATFTFQAARHPIHHFVFERAKSQPSSTNH